PHATAAPAMKAPTRSLPARPPAPERSSSGAPEEPLRVGGEVLRPQVIKRVEPDLSRLQDRKIRGTLVYEATITAKGEVSNVRVIRSRNPDIDAAVLAALRQWRFRPATRNGKPVAVYYTLTINFDLR